MTTAAISTFGVTLTRAGNLIAQISTIGAVKVSRAFADATDHGSPNGYIERIPGLKDMDAIPITGRVKVDDTLGQTALLADFEAGTLQTYVMTFPTTVTETWTFSAYIQDYQEGPFPVDGLVEFSCTLIRGTGMPTRAISASANLTALTGIEENTGAALTFLPAFAAAKKVYNVSVNTASSWVKFTPTLAGATINIYIAGVFSQTIASGAQSGTLALGAALTVTTMTLGVKETGKAENQYVVHVYRA